MILSRNPSQYLRLEYDTRTTGIARFENMTEHRITILLCAPLLSYHRVLVLIVYADFRRRKERKSPGKA